MDDKTQKEEIDSQRLVNYFNNISEFAKHNSISSFDKN